MGDVSVINIPEQYDKIELTIDNETDKNSMIDKPPHRGSPITKMEISPNGKYLVTYSEEDHTIVGWSVEDIDEERLELDIIVQTMTVDETTKGPEGTSIHQIKQICVSDDKKLAYIYVYEEWNRLRIVDMKNINQKIEMCKERGIEDGRGLYSNYCTFNLSNQLILYGNAYNNNDKIEKLDGCCIWIYSTQNTQTKDKKRIWTCEKPHEISKDFELFGFGISKDNFYIITSHKEWNITKVIRSIFGENIGEVIGRISVSEKDKIEADDIKVTSNEKFICLKFKDKIIVYSIELEISIATLDIHNDIQIYNFTNSDLYSLLPPFFSLFDCTTNNGIWNSIIKSCWKESLDRFKKDKEDIQLLTEETLPSNIQIKECLATKYAFGILNGYVWKFKFEEKMKEVKISNFDELSNEKDPDENDKPIDSWDACLSFDKNDKAINDSKRIGKNAYKQFNIHLFSSPYMSEILKLLQMTKYVNVDDKEMEFIQNKIKWKIKINKKELKLQVFLKNDKWILICTKSIIIENIEIIEKDIGGFYLSTIYKTYENKIFKNLIKNKKDENYDFMIIGSLSFNNNDIIILTTIGLFIFHFNENDKSIFLNYFYFMDLMSPKNREKNLQKYKKEFSKDTLPLPKHDSFKLNEWTSYVKDNKEGFLKYGVEFLTFAIKKHDLDLIDEIYEKCMEYFKEDVNNNKMFLSIITSTIPLLSEYYPEYIAKYSLDTDMIIDSPSYSREYQKTLHLHSFSKLPKLNTSIFYKIYSIVVFVVSGFSPTKSAPKVTLMIPYIKFVNYPQDYNRWKEFFLPQPSLFVKSINSKEIYRTWEKEDRSFTTKVLFNIPLIWVTISLLTIEVRKLIYKANKWVDFDFKRWIGNIINIAVCSLLIYTIALFQKGERNDVLFSFSTLFLFLKFFMLSAFYSKYYIILINVGKEVFLFLVIFIFFTILGFATAFYFLLSPKLPYSLDERTINDDPNNPWNMASTYQIFENQDDTNAKLFTIQIPDENTNMFANLGTAMFATFLLFTGDTSVLSSWTYRNNWALAILMLLFTFFTAIFILNVFIGLFSEAMNFDVKTSVLMMKANILAEVEMLYLLPHQRRRKEWFPEVMYYHADANKIREKIEQMINDNKKWTNKFPEMKQNLLKLLKIKNPQDNDALLRKLLKKVEKLDNDTLLRELLKQVEN